MDLQEVLDSLNPSQQEAARFIDGALLILAGAGSGKTKTITTRLAYLIEQVGIPASNTLTLTFTNKAAKEMRDRAMSMLTSNTQSPPLLCTFHRFGLLFLRFHIHLLGRKNNFAILDSTDKKNFIKNIDKTLPIAKIDDYISNAKNAYLSPSECAKNYARNDDEKFCNEIYFKYEQKLIEQNKVDFDDLLYLTYKILLENENLAQKTSNLYQYIMVDEYQDTNELQLLLLKRLCLTHNNLCVVGDDDQSIYGWRGANVSNILNFPKYFEGAKVVKLEHNYRSSEAILNAANALISHNKNRLGKTLLSTKGNLGEVKLLSFDNNDLESAFIANDIKQKINHGISPSQIAILFRINALSLSIENGLHKAEVPYKLIGAMRFFDRAEIKDLIAYLRVIVNFDDDFSLMRIINVPKRGLGSASCAKLYELASSLNKSILYTIEHHFDLVKSTMGKHSTTLKKLLDLFKHFQSLDDMSALIDNLESSIKFEFKEQEAADRMANIDEFYAMARDYFNHNEYALLQDFLNDLSLSSDSDSDVGECVSLMSMHSAKGLEFEYVYIIGFEEGFFPLVRGDWINLEEERRLGYVAFTRAKSHLYIFYVSSRFFRGKREYGFVKSRFVKEANLLPNITESSGKKHIESSLDSSLDSGFKVGDRVTHKLFGIGIIESIQEDKLVINFNGLIRTILKSFVVLA